PARPAAPGGRGSPDRAQPVLPVHAGVRRPAPHRRLARGPVPDGSRHAARPGAAPAARCPPAGGLRPGPDLRPRPGAARRRAPDPVLPWTADRMLSALRLAHTADTAADRPASDANGPVTATATSEVAGSDTPRPASGIALNSMIQRWDAEQAEPLRRAAAGTRVSLELCDHLQGTLDELRVMDKGSG